MKPQTATLPTHTPGPWFVVHDELCEHPWNFDVCAETKAADKQLIARIRIVPPVGDVEANARLIAAAPEMLEALERAEMSIHDLIIRTRKQCEYVDSLDGEGATEELRRYIRLSETAEKDIKAAIRKARGTE